MLSSQALRDRRSSALMWCDPPATSDHDSLNDQCRDDVRDDPDPDVEPLR